MARRVQAKLTYYARLALSGDLSIIASEIRHRIWSESREYRLTKDLSASFAPPTANIRITVDTLTADLAARLFATPGLGRVERRELEVRRKLWFSRLGTAHAALDSRGDLCFVAWTIPGSEADELQRIYPGYPRLEPDELLFLAAWTVPRARGQRIMGEAVSSITAAGARSGHTRAIAFVHASNERSIRGCCSAGFQIAAERVTTWRFGRKNVRSFAAAARRSAAAEAT